MTNFFDLGGYALFIGVGCLMLVAFMRVYTWMTPYNELQLIRDGNVAAALMLGGASLGFTAPIFAASRATVGIGQFIAVGVIACIVQAAVFWGAYWLCGKAATQNNVAAATLYLALSLAVGLLNAAAVLP